MLIPTEYGRHIDPDTLAGFAEHSLSQGDRESVFVHLAECEHCREWLRVFAGSRETVRRPAWSYVKAVAACLAVAALLSTVVEVYRHHRAAEIVMKEYKNSPSADVFRGRPVGGTNVSAGTVARIFSYPQLFSKTRTDLVTSTLPYPFALARLDRSDGFGQMGSTPQISPQNRIAIRTALGQRWIAVSLPQ